MQDKKEETIAGFNEYLESLSKKRNVLMTLTKFDSRKTDIVCSSVPVNKVKPLDGESYRPGETTPLYDAIGRTIRNAEDTTKKYPGISVLFVILTDGLENASTEWTKEKIVDLIKEKEKDGWTFAYLGAGQDARAVGVSYGISGQSTLDFANTGGGMVSACANLAAATDSYLAKDAIYTTSYFAKSADTYTEDDVKKYEAKIANRVKK